MNALIKSKRHAWKNSGGGQSLRIILPGKNKGRYPKGLYKRLKDIPRMLQTLLPLLFPKLDKRETERLYNYVFHLVAFKGPEYTIKYLKATQEIVWLLSSKGTFPNSGYAGISIGCDKDHWPKWLGLRLKSKVLDKRCHMSLRYILTLLSLRKCLIYHTYTKFESITQDTSIDDSVIQSNGFGSSFKYIRELGNRYLRNPEMESRFDGLSDDFIGHGSAKGLTALKPNYKWSMKSSPNGISYFSLLWDIIAITYTDQINHICNWSKVYYKPETVTKWIYEAVYYPLSTFLDTEIDPSEIGPIDYDESILSQRDNFNTGKVCAIQESGKTKPRVFAIVDIITNTVLSDFHDDLMKMLENIPEDCTFNHDKVTKVAKEQWIKRCPFYGYADLSDASDSIPKVLYKVIGNHLRPNLGTLWCDMFTQEFLVSKSAKSHAEPGIKLPGSVTYNTGQPMGALSSWPFMALVHHTIVWTAFGSREKALNKYLLLGDDIVIFDKDAYMRYLILLESLQISYTSNISITGFEFAKRYFTNGIEITGCYLNALYTSRNDPLIFCSHWRNLSSRSYTIIDLPNSFLKAYLKASPRKIREIRDLMYVPCGAYDMTEQLLKFYSYCSGQSDCTKSYTDKPIRTGGLKPDENLERAKLSIRQSAGIILRSQMMSQIQRYKRAIERSNSEFGKYLLKYNPGLGDQAPEASETIISIFQQSQQYKIYRLERDYKLLYTTAVEDINLAFRPKLPDEPHEINFNVERHGFNKAERFRCEHQLNLISFLRYGSIVDYDM